MTDKIVKSDDEWKKELSSQAYQVTRKKGTEMAFTGEFWNNHKNGTYTCKCCGQELFDSNTKYDSGSGWPSFYQPIKDEGVKTESDNTLGMVRTEVMCNRCDAHLGHVFEDGPKPTGLRYCINSVSLNFDEKK